MSIQGDIQLRLAEGRLCTLVPAFPRVSQARQLFLDPQVETAVVGPWSDPTLERRFSRARALLEAFVEGHQIVVRMPPKKGVRTLLALLEPPTDNVWEFRISEPKRGVRVFGMFAARDVFIATNWALRETLAADDQRTEDRLWRDEMLKAKTIWNRLFPSYAPLSGDELDDFITNARLLE